MYLPLRNVNKSYRTCHSWWTMTFQMGYSDLASSNSWAHSWYFPLPPTLDHHDSNEKNSKPLFWSGSSWKNLAVFLGDHWNRKVMLDLWGCRISQKGRADEEGATGSNSCESIFVEDDNHPTIYQVYLVTLQILQCKLYSCKRSEIVQCI